MKLAILLLSLAFALVLCVGYFWYIFESILNSRPLRVGYVSTNLDDCLPALQSVIKKYVSNTKNTVFIEPGCGLAHVSRWAAAKYSWKKLLAIDLRYTLLFTAKVLDRFAKTGINFERADIFAKSYPRGSLVYCYLRTPMLDKLYAEGKFAGCLVVVLSFEITGVAPKQNIPLAGWQKRMLVYDFRN